MFPDDPVQPSASPRHSPPTVCYFSITPSPSASPNITPLSGYYYPETPSDPNHPFLALRTAPEPEHPSSQHTMDASKFLRLQTNAAHRPSVQPVQSGRSGSSSVSSTSSSSSSQSPTSLSSEVVCSRCRRTSLSSRSMVHIGINLYYCGHCASMTGYGSG